MRDSKKVQEQEKKNYDRATEIFNKILPNKHPQFKQMPEFSVSDMRMQVATNQYNIELKGRSTSIYEYNEQPLKVKKYINLVKDTKPNETLLYMAIIDDGNWYIWNLSKLDWRTVKLDNMTAKKQEYNIGGSEYVCEPYFFLPLDTACLTSVKNNSIIQV